MNPSYYSTRATRRRARLRAAQDLAGGVLMVVMAYGLVLAAWAVLLSLSGTMGRGPL